MIVHGPVEACLADRGSCQGKVGHMAPEKNHDGGHLIAATLHGVDERYDMVPQWYSINRGIYLRMESGAKDCLKEPGGKSSTTGSGVLPRLHHPGPRPLPHRRPCRHHRAHRPGHRTGHPNEAISQDEYQRIRDRLNTPDR
jgi:hypothetical protein